MKCRVHTAHTAVLWGSAMCMVLIGWPITETKDPVKTGRFFLHRTSTAIVGCPFSSFIVLVSDMSFVQTETVTEIQNIQPLAKPRYE